MRLDSFGYRLLWNIKRALRFRDSGPHPIVWKAPRRFAIPDEFRSAFNEDDNKRLNLIQDELERLSSIYSYLPNNITLEQWKQLLSLRFLRERFHYITFLRQKELRSVKDERKQNARSLNKQLKINNNGSDYVVECETQENANELVEGEVKEEENEEKSTGINMPAFIFCPANMRIKWERQLECMRYLTTTLCHEETPKLIIDCRFLAMHSFRGMNLTLKQLTQLISTNRARALPWPLFFANFDDAHDENFMNARKKHLSIIDSVYGSTVQVNSESYIKLFPQQYAEGRLIYLSPHAAQPLQRIEADKCYIIGGIVDRVAEPRIPNKASLQLAEAEGLPCFRLPIDEHVDWKRGNKMLTITGVASILADAYQRDSDWREVLQRHIPLRKLAEERNVIVQLKYKNLSLFKREVLRIMLENSKIPDPPRLTAD